MKKAFTRDKILRAPFVDLPSLCQNMKNMQELEHELEALSVRAGMMAAYIGERHGYGCGDQGHNKALKAMNKAGKAIHVKAFGYNAFNDLSF
jgi:phosphopantothenate synthetase